jgi:transketolase
MKGAFPLNSNFLRTVCGKLDQRSIDLRRRIIRMLLSAGRGHLAPAFSVVDIIRVLYDDILNYKPENPRWDGRDKFILSKGHACMAQYVLLADKGFFEDKCLDSFCKPGSFLGGHPEFPHVPGVEASTGSLGHGPSLAVGMALAAKSDRINSRIFVLVGDGEANEGAVWESALSAVKHRLDNLVLIVDCNGLQSYGSTSEVLDLDPFPDKWASFGWAVTQVDGHNISDLRKTFSKIPRESGRPTAVICKTVKGAGIKNVEHNLAWHHKSGLTVDEAEILMDALEGGGSA